jgi:hypothetical protein
MRAEVDGLSGQIASEMEGAEPFPGILDGILPAYGVIVGDLGAGFIWRFRASFQYVKSRQVCLTLGHLFRKSA